MKEHLHIKVRDSDNVIYDEDIYALTSFNKEGKFDVLPLHANFISIIEKQIIIQTVNGEKKEININKGILKAYENNLEVYLGIDLIEVNQTT